MNSRIEKSLRKVSTREQIFRALVAGAIFLCSAIGATLLSHSDGEIAKRNNTPTPTWSP